MEWKLLIPFNYKSDGIFQINQHPSKMYFGGALHQKETGTFYDSALAHTHTHISQLYEVVFMGRVACAY